MDEKNIANESAEELEEVIEDTEDTDVCEDENTDEEDAVSEYNDTATQFSDLEDALSEANDKYLRLFAEYDNYRKRTAREKTETYQNASAKCVENLLPVIDSF